MGSLNLAIFDLPGGIRGSKCVAAVSPLTCMLSLALMVRSAVCCLLIFMRCIPDPDWVVVLVGTRYETNQQVPTNTIRHKECREDCTG